MKAVITVTGKDNIGIIAKVSNYCSDFGVNIVDVAQSVMKEYFAMIMLVDIDGITIPFVDFIDKLNKLGENNRLKIDAMHEDLFNSMHRI